jgi:hypothetical protein
MFVLKALKYIFHSNAVACFLRSNAFFNFIVGLSGIYFVLYELVPDVWLFSVYPNIAKLALIVFAATCAFSYIAKLVDDIYKHYNLDRISTLNLDMIELYSSLVRSKTERFKTKLPSLTQSGDTFKNITDPKAQIKEAIAVLHKVMQQNFNISDDEIFISIIKLPHENDKTDPHHISEFCFPRTKMTKAREILDNGNSTASLALARQQTLFFADKKKALEKNCYFVSERDTRDGRKINGSIFCYPISIQLPDDKTVKYVISVSTYGKKLCSHFNEEFTYKIKLLLSDICSRIEMELTLLSMKEWRGLE